MIKLKIFIISILLLVFVGNELYSQKVGVVLSGGGPRGVTHVGVLKALEEYNIPIDYIVGTSMGAIIGGLYAAGYSATEIESIIISQELQDWLSSDIDPRFNDYYKKSKPNASWKIFKLKYDSIVKAQIPTNIISPHKLDFGFLELYSGASAASNYNFDQLFVPFRCVAADVAETKEMVFNKGPLEKAIRASMTFPFYFKPIKIDGKLMFDGGLYNNFPVDVMELEFNPDVIIGSKAANNYGPPREDDAVSMIQSMLMSSTKYDVPEDRGVLIEPDLWSVNVTDFSNAKAFIDSGYVSTVRKIPELRKQIKNISDRAIIDKKRNDFRKSIPKLEIRDIIIKGVTEERQKYIKKVINVEDLIIELNDSVNDHQEVLAKIKDTYFLILADEKIDVVYPEIIYSEGAYNLIFNVSLSNQIEMEIGGLVSSRAINEIFFQINYSRWGSKAFSFIANTYLGRFHNSLHLNGRLDFPGKVPFFIQGNYTLNGWNYFNTTTYFFEDETPSFLKQQDNFWSFGVGTKASRYGKLIALLESGRKRDEYYQTNNFTRLDTSDITSFDFYSPGISFEINTLNRKQYASEGTYLKLSGRYISGLEKNTPGSTSKDPEIFSKYHDWILLQFKLDKYFPLSRSVNMGFLIETAISDKEVFHNYTSTVLAAPAFEPLPEGQVIFLPQFRAHTFLAGGLKLVIQAFHNLDIRTEAYIFQPYEEIIKNDANQADMGPVLSNRFYIFSGRGVYHAPFGPISMSIDYYDAANEPWVFNINIGYYIFNDRPFN
jgi:NTE family protein